MIDEYKQIPYGVFRQFGEDVQKATKAVLAVADKSLIHLGATDKALDNLDEWLHKAGVRFRLRSAKEAPQDESDIAYLVTTVISSNAAALDQTRHNVDPRQAVSNFLHGLVSKYQIALVAV